MYVIKPLLGDDSHHASTRYISQRAMSHLRTLQFETIVLTFTYTLQGYTCIYGHKYYN